MSTAGPNSQGRINGDVPLDVAIVYYSHTGTTASVADAIADWFEDPTIIRVRPTKTRSYPNWLARSFIPGSTVSIEPIETDLTAYDFVLLGSPKWTLSCPPMTRYLRKVDVTDVPTGVFLTYGGFDEERYLDGIVRKLNEKGADVKGTLRVKRSVVEDGRYEDGVAEFCNGLVETLS